MKGFNFFEQNNENIGKDSLNLVGMQLKLLRFLGILLPDKINKIIFTMTVLYYISGYFIVLAIIPHYWDNISMITEILFQFFILTDAFILRIYLMYNQNKFHQLFCMIDTYFIKFINNSVSTRNRVMIISKIKRESKAFTYVFLAILTAVISAWSLLGYIKKSVNDVDKLKEDENIYDYFSIVSWLPKDPLAFPQYEITYLHQISATGMVVCHYTAVNVIFFFFMYYTAAHFELLISCIEDIDVKFPDENIDDLEDMTNTNKTENKAHSYDEFKKHNEETWEQNVEPVSEQDTSDISSIEECKTDLLINCIKYHQAILE